MASEGYTTRADTDGGASPARPLLVRLAAELATKSRRTRGSFQSRLATNVRDALGSTGAPFELEVEWSRFLVRSDSVEALQVLTRVSGLSSISPVDAVVPADLDEIVEAGRRLYAERVKGGRYAVRARRTGTHSFSSRDIHMRLGAALNPGATVDLDDPDVRVEVEVREDVAYLFTERIPGAGGLPLGVEGKALALISGGYDSAVAAALMLKRGVELDYAFCNLAGEAYERAVLQVAKVLADDWSYGTRPRLISVDFTEAVDALRREVKPSHLQVVLKRLMYRLASRIAEEAGAEAIVTGEALGQVSSQTLANLRAIEAGCVLPVFRPLIGFDKNEIIERARDLGTATLSEKVREYCALGTAKPVTGAGSEAVDREESRLDPELLDRALAGARIHDLRSLTTRDLIDAYLFTDRVPEGAVVLDCRPEASYREWHYPGAEHRDEWRMFEEYRKEPKDRVYVLYCARGMKSAVIAERMQREGYEAYSFRDGAEGIRNYAASIPVRPPTYPGG
jgi:tRNA uracil 4-sulfurtransferase